MMNKAINILFGICMMMSHSVIGLEISSSRLENENLYPVTVPFQEGYLRVSDLHQIYYSEFGNPQGIPILVVHGGPGAGCSHSWSSFFNPSIFHVIMFDQRGARRSIPFAEMEDNTPQNSISDMECLRHHLKIDKWYLFGGSWGSALSLLYAEAHPTNVLGLVLRGIFLAREQDYTHLFYGMRNTYPEAWAEMVEAIGENEYSDLISSFHKKVMDPDPKVHLNAARAFMFFDTLCAYLLPNQEALNDIKHNDNAALGIGRAYIHYSANHFFLEENQIFNNIDKIQHIPTIIVHGRYDVICPVKQAYDLHVRMPHSELWIVPDAGHSSGEPSIAKSLKMAVERIVVGHVL